MAKGVRKFIVQKIVADGKHGPYAAVLDPNLGTITFSLKAPVWKEKRFPEEGSAVVLRDFEEKTAGWRAMSARFFRPTDTLNNSKKQSA